MKTIFKHLISGLLLPTLASAAPMSVTPSTSHTNYTNVVVTDVMPNSREMEQANTLTIRWKAGCFGTNLRFVDNPLSNTSRVQMHLKLANVSDPWIVSCPATITDPKYNKQPNSNTIIPCTVSISTAPAATAEAIGNYVQAKVPAAIPAKEGIQPDGSYSLEHKSSSAFIESIRFEQVLPPNYTATGQYPPQDGLLTADMHYSLSPDGTVLDVASFFPGIDKYCGGYYSPLMLFTTDSRPGFRGKSDFPLVPGESIFWPEPGAPGYFLALDEKGDRQISKAEQLFGNSVQFKNGFESLKIHDVDGNHRIDSKDPVFSKLVLWRDANGNGKSDRGEVQSVSKFGLIFIDLNYEDEGIRSFGDRARAMGSAPFKYKDRNSGKARTGNVIDIWFSTYFGK